jgi:hypothetical protein
LVLIGSSFEEAALEELAELASGTISVDAYLDTDDPEKASRAIVALDNVAHILGYSDPVDETIERGSFWRRAKAFIRKGLTSQEFTDRMTKLERAIELRAIYNHQADVDLKVSEAVSQLVASMEGISQACLQVGSILMVKYEDATGPVLITRTMSATEVRALERFPEIQRNPRKAIEALVTATLTLEPVTEERGPI